MRRLLMVGGFLVWTVVVCAGTFRATFPSDVVAERIRYEVPLRLGRGWTADVGTVVPWWAGVSVSDVKLFQQSFAYVPAVPRSVPASGSNQDDEEGEETDEEPSREDGPKLVAAFDNVSVRLSPWSIAARAPVVVGSVSFGERVLHGTVGTTIGARGEVHLDDLVLAGEVPLDALLAFGLEGATGQGALELDVDLVGGEFGMKDSSGRMAVRASKLVISDIEVPGMGALGMEIQLSDLTLIADVVDGRATVTEGKIVSELATISVSGEINLRDPIDRSAYDLQFVISELGPQLAAFQGFLAGAKQSDGTFLYSCRGTVGRPSPSGCSSRPRTATARPPTTTRPTTPGVALTEAEREEKKNEIKERLRREREQRQGGATPTPPEADATPEDDGAPGDPPEPPVDYEEFEEEEPIE